MVCQGPLITQSSNHPEYAQWPVHVDSPGALSSGGCCLYECGHCKDELGLPLYLCVSVWELDCEETWHWRIDAFELWCWRRLLRVPWTTRRSNQSNPKGNQSWIFIRKTDAEAETPVLWPPHAKNWLIWRDPDAGKDWRQEEKVTTEDETVGWHHWLNGHEFEQAPGVVDGQGSLVCCSPWGHNELDTTGQLNWTESY